ncbi:MAG TPA: N-acetylmuramoyl-L-alanine amidase [Candidatus Peribacterales bacterium]|nr:N-acetylmuramoyl-L-alanine amidase [Candidatus Peribacterales bacterium]
MRFPLLQALCILCLSLFFFVEGARAEVTSTPLTIPAKKIVTQEVRIPATGVALSLTNDATVEIQAMEHGEWSDWKIMRVDGDADPREKDSELLFVNDATAVRLRSSAPTNVTLHTIAVERDTTSKLEAAAAGRSLTPAPVIIPRWQWGANEKLRTSDKGDELRMRAFYTTPELVMRCDRRALLYPEEFREKKRKFTEDVDENGKEDVLLWPLSYSDKIDVIVMHHTAEDSPASLARTDMERMRTVYEYHTVARKWGDIGYNFVIGPSGTIFEGRAGGDYAVGAHAFCNNVGTMGVSLMGNFQADKPTDAQLTALRWLLVYLTDKYKIDPAGQTIYHGKTMPTIIGHRDVGQTACPGNFSHELLPQVRYATKERKVDTPLFSTAARASTEDEAALMESLLPVTVTMGQQGKVKVRFMNVGKDTWNKETWLLAKGDPGLYFTRVRPFSFVASTMEEQSVAPGEIATFNVPVQGGLSEKRGSIAFTPVVNNDRRLVSDTAPLSFTTKQGSPRFTFVTSYFPPLHKTGEDLTGTVKLVNAGTVPWEQNSLTEIGFDVSGGTGEATILSATNAIAPGEQGTFRLSIQNVEETGPYERTVTPRFAEGSPLVGGSITLASRAEPIPEIALAGTHSAATTFLAYRNDRATEVGGAIIEALAAPEFTLSPREQATFTIRIRTGKRPIARFQEVAPIVRSNPTITLLEEAQNLRMRDTLRSPVSLAAYQSMDMKLILIAPKTEGEYTLSIGDIPFLLTVRPHGKFLVESKRGQAATPPRSMRTVSPENLITERRALRSSRLERRAPPATRTKQPTDVRIRLTYGKNSAIITSPVTMRIDGLGGVILENGPAHLSIEQDKCKVSTANGNLLADVMRFTPTVDRNFLTIMTQEKSTNRFRGTLECRIINGTMTFINELGIEEYLAGLAEEPDSEPWEKQRAFAIAARSYALYYVLSPQRKFPGKPYDGSDDPREFQAYGGVFFEEKNPRWVQAVQDTTSKVIAWQRKLVKPPYFSSDDGQTKSATDVWGWMNTPYLDSKPDPWCKGMQNSGHGVGMSGCGAEGQANEGKIAEDILQYYYPSTHILPVEKVSEWEEKRKGKGL